MPKRSALPADPSELRSDQEHESEEKPRQEPADVGEVVDVWEDSDG